MKEFSKMLLPELQNFATKAEKLEDLWSILENCKGDAQTIQNISINPLTRLDNQLVWAVYRKGDIRTKRSVARYTTIEGIIDDAAHSDKCNLRSAAAANPNANLFTLVWLSKDPWVGARSNALNNPKVKDNDTILKILHDTAKNAGLPILLDYGKLSLSELQERAPEVENVKELWIILENCKGDAHTIQNIVENPYAHSDPELIRKAYEAGDNRVKCTIARDTDLTDIIEMAMNSNNRRIRSAVALNPNITEEDLIKLFHDLVFCVRVSALSNVHTTKDMILDMALNDPSTDARILAQDVLNNVKKG